MAEVGSRTPPVPGGPPTITPPPAGRPPTITPPRTGEADRPRSGGSTGTPPGTRSPAPPPQPPARQATATPVPRPVAVPPAEADWTEQAADMIESVVGTIRDKSVVPLTTVARGLVYGTIVAVVGIVALVVLVITLVRVLDVLLPLHVGHTHARSVWVAYALVGGIFSLGGLFLLRKARAGHKG